MFPQLSLFNLNSIYLLTSDTLSIRLMSHQITPTHKTPDNILNGCVNMLHRLVSVGSSRELWPTRQHQTKQVTTKQYLHASLLVSVKSLAVLLNNADVTECPGYETTLLWSFQWLNINPAPLNAALMYFLSIQEQVMLIISVVTNSGGN